MIRYFSAHPTAANLMMIGLAALGIIFAPQLLRETFPRVEPKRVNVLLVYPGAAAEEIERALCLPAEEALQGVDDVAEITCAASAGSASITVEMRAGGELSAVSDDVEREISAISSFPSEVEDPIVTEAGRTDAVASVTITGIDRATDLSDYAEDVAARMRAFGGIPKVDVSGFADRQIRVEISAAAARAMGLSLQDVASAISAQNIGLPSGEIDGAARRFTLRVDDQRTALDAYRDIVIASSADGAEIRLGDVAQLSDRLEHNEDAVLYNGERAALLAISKSPNDDALRVRERIDAFLAAERLAAPPGVAFSVVDDVSTIVADRLEMVIRNGIQGLFLVFLAVWAIFGLRQGVWIAAGLPISFLGAMAAIEGAREVAPGVISSFLTTAAIFGSLAFLDGDIGEVLKVIPVVMLLVLIVSLVEAFLILPNHLSHVPRADPNRGVRGAINRVIDHMRERFVGRIARAAVSWRYLTLGLAFGAFFSALALFAGGVIKFSAFPEIDGDTIQARITMPAGATLEDTERAAAEIAAAAGRVNDALADGAPLVTGVTTRYGVNSDATGGGPHLATISIDLTPGDSRTVENAEIIALWRAETPRELDLHRLAIAEPGLGPAGQAIELSLIGEDLEMLSAAADYTQTYLLGFDGVENLSDDLEDGPPEVRFRLLDGASALGLTSNEIARQISAAFQGVTASEVQIGRETVEIRVALLEEDRDGLEDLDNFAIQTPAGAFAPLSAVAEAEFARGPSQIRRIDERRTVTIKGDVDTRFGNASEIVAVTTAHLEAVLAAQFPGVALDVRGQNAEAAKTSTSMLSGVTLGLIAVYIVLSFQLRSYVEPITVMIVIPFALVGALLGHLLLGYDFTMPSMLGVAALSGIVVNDSILLVNQIKERHDPNDLTAAAAAPKAAMARFRAILLTSVTTILGLLPLLFETSLQAQVLIPLVISIAFGLMATTVLVLFVVPAFFAVLDDWGLTSLARERKRAAQRALAAAE